MLSLHRSKHDASPRPRAVVGRLRIDLPEGHRHFAVTDRPRTAASDVLPFSVAWLFEPVSYLGWQRIAAAFGFGCASGSVQLNDGEIQYGCWLLNLDVEQATAAATLAGRPQLVRWTPQDLAVYPTGINGPSVTFGWQP